MYLCLCRARVSAAMQAANANRIPLSFDYVIHAEFVPGSSAGLAFRGQAASHADYDASEDPTMDALSSQASDALILEALESLTEEDIVDMQSTPV